MGSTEIVGEDAKAERALDRYYDAFENGARGRAVRRPRFRPPGTPPDPRDQAAQLAAELPTDARDGPDGPALAAVADQLELVVAAGSPQKTKALLRLLIKELKVNGRSEILPTYRVLTPEVCATPSSVVLTGHLSNPPGPVSDVLSLFRLIHEEPKRKGNS